MNLTTSKIHLGVQGFSPKDWVGTSTGLWAIVSAVYLSLMGPKGMKELGEGILQKSHYAAKKLNEVDGIEIRFKDFFKEFPVNFDGTNLNVSEINQGLMSYKIFGGKDISKEFPELGQNGLFCFTELHTKKNIKRLVETLKEVL